jgi:hypothetical protein
MIMNGLKKGLLFTMMLAALSLALTGCFRSTTEVTPTPTPVPLVTGAVGATVMPGASLLPGQTLFRAGLPFLVPPRRPVSRLTGPPRPPPLRTASTCSPRFRSAPS